MLCRHGNIFSHCVECTVIDKIYKKLTQELDIYTVVRIARKEIEEGKSMDAIARLKIDADKLIMHDKELVRLLSEL